MNEKEMQAEELQTMELFSGKIEAETPCAPAADAKSDQATERVDEAVTAAAERARAGKPQE